MKYLNLLAVSAIALMVTYPAFADNANPEQKPSGKVEKDIKNAWEDVKKDASEAYENIKATFIDENEGVEGKVITIDSRMTASGMIGKPVYNGKSERVGTLKDIILNKDGNAVMVIVADGEFPGLSGKLVAFDYGSIARQNAEGDVIMPLTEDMINKAAEFSYDQQDRNNDMRILPADGYSVAKLLDANLLDQENTSVAYVDNIFFKGGKADQLIVSFDNILGMGGEKAALNYSSAKIVGKDDDVDFQLNAAQAAKFESHKKTFTN